MLEYVITHSSTLRFVGISNLNILLHILSKHIFYYNEQRKHILNIYFILNEGSQF